MLSTTQNTNSHTHTRTHTRRNFWKFMLIKKFVGFLQTTNYFLLQNVQQITHNIFAFIFNCFWQIFNLFLRNFLNQKKLRNILFCWPLFPSLPRPFAEFRVQKIWTIFPQFSYLQYCGFQPDSALVAPTLLCLNVCECVCELWMCALLPRRSCWTPLIIAPSTPPRRGTRK